MISQPLQTALHQGPPAESLNFIIGGFRCLVQSHYGGGGGQRGGRQSTGPPTLLITVRQEKGIDRVNR
jgi:hypothetical protein